MSLCPSCAASKTVAFLAIYSRYEDLTPVLSFKSIDCVFASSFISVAVGSSYATVPVRTSCGSYLYLDRASLSASSSLFLIVYDLSNLLISLVCINPATLF